MMAQKRNASMPGVLSKKSKLETNTSNVLAIATIEQSRPLEALLNMFEQNIIKVLHEDWKDFSTDIVNVLGVKWAICQKRNQIFFIGIQIVVDNDSLKDLGIKRYNKCIDQPTTEKIKESLFGFAHINRIIEYLWMTECITDIRRKEIKSASLYDQSEAITSLLMKDDHCFFNCIVAFLEYGPQIIVDILDIEDKDSRPMNVVADYTPMPPEHVQKALSDEQRAELKSSHMYLIENMDTADSGLADYLLEKNVINQYDKQFIEEIKEHSEKNIFILHTIYKKRSDCLQNFKTCLEATGQHYLVEFL